MARQLILDVARAAGRQVHGPTQRGEYLIQCPRSEAHTNNDAHPSCRVNAAKGVFFCDVCQWGGGTTELAEALGSVADATPSLSRGAERGLRRRSGRTPQRFKPEAPV